MPSNAQRIAVRERPSGIAVMRQRWAGLLFLHWRVETSLIRDRLPPGLHVDTFGDQAWIGIVPFFMQRVRPIGLPPVPWLSWFMELNVRTYVHDDAGNPGVWFFSLDCNQPVAVEIARHFFHLPYQHAAMNCVNSGADIHYRCQRKFPGTAEAAFEYAPPTHAAPAVPGTLEWFLVERYVLFSSNRENEIFCGRVHHAPYQIASANCACWSAEPLVWDGFPVPDRPPESLLTADPVDVEIFPLRRAR